MATYPVITLLTDFGLKDGIVGVMKGVILGIAPEAHLVDLSHEIKPQDVREAAILLGRVAGFFPPGTIHLVVVDPGVGTSRRPMAARLGEHYFVGPDNGAATRIMARAERQNRAMAFIHLDRPEWWLPEVSSVFHGRDIFAPVAARLAGGTPLQELGKPFADPVRLDLPSPQAIPGGLRGMVEHIDHFGNLRTNILREDCSQGTPSVVLTAGVEIGDLVRTFGDRPAGDLVAFWGSSGELCVAEVNGSAAHRLRVSVGEPVEIRLRP